MLHLARNADYAMRVMLEVAAHPEGRISTSEVARRQSLPYQFLRKLVQTLVSHGLLISERGVRGGLSLARRPEEISMLDVINAFGFPGLNDCTSRPPQCDRRDFCAAYPVWVETQQSIENTFARALLSDLIKRQAILERTCPSAGKGEVALQAASTKGRPVRPNRC